MNGVSASIYVVYRVEVDGFETLEEVEEKVIIYYVGYLTHHSLIALLLLVRNNRIHRVIGDR
jgi:hypothetical protein